MNKKLSRELIITMLLLGLCALFSTSALAYTRGYNNNFGYGAEHYLSYANKPTGAYGVYGGPGNAYYRGQPVSAASSARFSSGYTNERYGLSDLRTNNYPPYSPGFTPRYGVVQGGVNDGFAFSPGYTDQRYGLPLEQNDGFYFSPGYMPRYGMMRYNGPQYVNSRPRALYTAR